MLNPRIKSRYSAQVGLNSEPWPFPDDYKHPGGAVKKVQPDATTHPDVSKTMPSRVTQNNILILKDKTDPFAALTEMAIATKLSCAGENKTKMFFLFPLPDLTKLVARGKKTVRVAGATGQGL